MQVCVPREWDDDAVVKFAEAENPCGTEAGWHIRREGDEALKDAPERNQCLSIADNCHIVLDA